MSDFWKKANSTEFSCEQRVCYDTTYFDSSIVFEHEESYAEYRFERQCESYGWNQKVPRIGHCIDYNKVTRLREAPHKINGSG